MKVAMRDQREEDRKIVRDRQVPGYESHDRAFHRGGKNGHTKRVSDYRSVIIYFDPEDYAELGIPETEKGSRKGKHDGTFYVKKVELSFSRRYGFDEDDNPAETQHGWGKGGIHVGGINKLAAGGEGVKHNNTSYPKWEMVDDETRPFTFDNWRKQVTFSGDLETLRRENIQTLDDLRAAVANFDNEGKSYRSHSLAYELRQIEEGERGERFFQKRITHPLPDWLAAIVTEFHPATGLEFIEPNENTYGPAFPDQRAVSV